MYIICRYFQNPPTPESGIANGDLGENDHQSEPTALSPLPTVPRRRKNPVELQEAGKTMKEAISSLHKVLNKPQVVEDDFDRYGKILANKLRKLSESESLKIMYEIDGLFIKRLNTTLHGLHRFTHRIQNQHNDFNYHIRILHQYITYGLNRHVPHTQNQTCQQHVLPQPFPIQIPYKFCLMRL